MAGECDQAVVCGAYVTREVPSVVCLFVERQKVARKVYVVLVESQAWQSKENQAEDVDYRRIREIYGLWEIEPKTVKYVEDFSEREGAVKRLAQVYGECVEIGGVKGEVKSVEGIWKLVEVIEGKARMGGMIVVNVFGMDGKNVMIVMKADEEYKNSEKSIWSKEYSSISSQPRLFTCSARSCAELEQTLDQVRHTPAAYPTTTKSFDQDKFRAYTILNQENKIEHVQISELLSVAKRPVFFLFNGTINTDLLASYEQLMSVPVFRQSIEQATEVLRPYGINLVEVITKKHLHQKEMNVSVAHTAIQVALIDCLKSAGIQYTGLIGYSLGELACAYADHSLTFSQTILIAYEIAKTLNECRMPSAAMATVALSWPQAQKRMPLGLMIACHNSEHSVTVSGPATKVTNFVQELLKENIQAKVLSTNQIALHSEYMCLVAAELKKRLVAIVTKPVLRSKEWLSSSFGQQRWANSEMAKWASAEYFVNMLCSSVLFKETFDRNVPEDAIVVEIGPQSVGQMVKKVGYFVPLIQAGEQKEQLVKFLSKLGGMYVQGVDMSVNNLYKSVKYFNGAEELKSQIEKKYTGLLEVPCKWRQSCECDNQVSSMSQCKWSLLKYSAMEKLDQVKVALADKELSVEQENMLEVIEYFMHQSVDKQGSGYLEGQYELVMDLERELFGQVFNKTCKTPFLEKTDVQAWKHIQELKECILDQMPIQKREQYIEASSCKVASAFFGEYMQKQQQEKLAKVFYFLAQMNLSYPSRSTQENSSSYKRILEEIETLVRLTPTHKDTCIAQLQKQLELVHKLDISWSRQEAKHTRMIQDFKDIICEQIKYFKHQMEKELSVLPEQYPVELSAKYQAKYIVDLSDRDEQSMLGHQIQGKHIYPASGFIYIVWKSFAKMNNQASVDSCPIQFTNVKFLHQITFNKNDKIMFTIEIDQLTGLFQLIESSRVVCTGCVEALSPMVEFKQLVQTVKLVETVSQREIYQCLKQRGYDFDGEFKSIAKTSVDGTYGELVWSGKWIQFLDGMIQMNLLANKTRSEMCSLPTMIKSLRIEPACIKQEFASKNVRFEEDKIAFESQDENNNSSRWLNEEYHHIIRNESSFVKKFEWFTKVQAVMVQQILSVRTWMRQQQTTLTFKEMKMLEELETMMCQFQRSYSMMDKESLTEQVLSEVLNKLQDQSEHITSILSFAKQPVKQMVQQKQSGVVSSQLVADLKQMVCENLQYQEREQMVRQQTCSEQKKYNFLYRRQLDIMRSLMQSEMIFPVEMDILEDLERMIKEQMYNHKNTGVTGEFTVEQWMMQLRQQQQMLNEYYVQAQAQPEVRSVYTFLVKFCKEQLQQEMDFITESKQMYGFVLQKLTLNLSLVQKLIALLNGQEESPLKRMYLEKLEQLVQEMYDQTMLTQAIQESMQEAYKTRCVQLKESMAVLEKLTSIRDGSNYPTLTSTSSQIAGQYNLSYAARQMQLIIDELRSEADRLSEFYVQKEEAKRAILPVFYNPQTRSIYSRGIELTGLYMAPVVVASPVTMSASQDKQFTELFVKDETKTKQNELIEMDLLSLIEAMHSLESLRETAETLKDTAHSLRYEQQQQPIQMTAKFTTKVSFSPLQAYISSTLDQAERQLIEETMASLTAPTPLVKMTKKHNYLMPQTLIEPLNQVETYANMTPVFIVHPIEGHTNTLRNLAKNIRSPVFGIQYTRHALKYETVSELANFYWTQIQKQFGQHTRIHLCGHAFGGIVALEMAANKPAACTSLTILDDNMTNISYDMYRQPRAEMEADALMKFALQYYQNMDKIQFFTQLTAFKTTEQRIRFIVKELISRSQFQFEAIDLEHAARAFITKYVMQCLYTPELTLRMPTVYLVKCAAHKSETGSISFPESFQARTYLQELVSQCFFGQFESEIVDCDARSFLEGNNGYQVATIMNENLLRHF